MVATITRKQRNDVMVLPKFRDVKCLEVKLEQLPEPSVSNPCDSSRKITEQAHYNQSIGLE